MSLEGDLEQQMFTHLQGHDSGDIHIGRFVSPYYVVFEAEAASGEDLVDGRIFPSAVPKPDRKSVESCFPPKVSSGVLSSSTRVHLRAASHELLDSRGQVRLQGQLFLGSQCLHGALALERRRGARHWPRLQVACAGCIPR